MRAALFALVLSACSFVTRSAPVPNRYFTPELTSATIKSEKGTRMLRLGHVTASASLRSRIVHRDSPVELGMYETLRWTDDPEVFVRAALHRALFDSGALRESAGELPVLDVEVLAFEEVRKKNGRGGRVELRWHLRQTSGFLDGVASAEKPARRADMESIVLAISAALQDVVAKVATDVATELR